MDVESAINQHYLFSTEHPHSQRTRVKSFHKFEDGRHHQMLAIANHNNLEIYRNVGSSLVYGSSHQFMCDISVLEVIPIKGQTSDILFLADEDGRYMFWSPAHGALLVSNKSRSSDINLPFYQNDSPETKQPQFSDVHYTFNSLTTKATIFFNIKSSKVVIIRIQAHQNTVHDIIPPAQFKIPYADINYIGLIKGKNPSIGFVEQQEEKTILQIHSLNSQSLELIYALDKSNLSRFYCSQNGQQLITVCNSQLSITNIKTNKLICNFQISESGFVSALDHERYIFVGEVGSQMIVFGKKHYKNYGSFMLENDRCVVLDTHGCLNDGGFLISVIDQGFTVQILAIYEHYWKSIKSISSIASIFSIQEMESASYRDPNQNQCLAVVKISDNIHQVGIISKKVPSKLEKQTSIDSCPILQTFAFNDGKAIILCNEESNTVLNYSQSLQNFQVSFELPPEQILLAINGYLVTTQKIYEINLTKNRINQIYVQKEKMVAADFDGQKYIGFQCGNFAYKFYNLETKQIDWVRKNCHQQYIWKFHLGELLVGSMNSPQELKIVPLFSAPKPSLNLRIDDMISDMENMGQTDCLVVSFVSSVINIYIVSTKELLYTYAASSEGMRVMKCGDKLNGILAYGPASAHYFCMDNKQGIVCKQIQFNNSKDIIDCVFLKQQNQILITHQDCLANYSLNSDKISNQDHSSTFKILSVSISDNSDDVQAPLATTQDIYLYVLSPYEVVKRDLLSSQLIKKQSHSLKQVSCIENIGSGLLVCGIDDMDYAQMVLFDYNDLQIISTQSLYKQIVSGARLLKNDTFFLRVDQFVNLYEFIPSTFTFKQKFTFKTGLYGFTLAVQPSTNMLIISDPLRYVAVYNYQFNKLTALSRYGNLNTINDIEFVSKSVIFGDTIGNVSVLEFNLGQDEVTRTKMSEVGTLRYGSEVMYIRKAKSDQQNSVIFGALSGYIGRVTAIKPQIFSILKDCEQKGLKLIQQKQKSFDYQGWRKRPNLQDKIIDEVLIQQFLHQANQDDPTLENLNKVWPIRKNRNNHD